MPLPKQYRLPLRTERENLNTKGKKIHSQHLTVIKLHQEDQTTPRFSILVSKKTQKSAVGRNKLRRQISGAITPLLPKISPADYLLIPRSSIITQSPKEITQIISEIIFQR